MKKNWLEIGVSAGLVVLMIVLMLVVGIAAPVGIRSAGFALIMLLFIVLMGFAGIKLIDMP